MIKTSELRRNDLVLFSSIDSDAYYFTGACVNKVIGDKVILHLEHLGTSLMLLINEKDLYPLNLSDKYVENIKVKGLKKKSRGVYEYKGHTVRSMHELQNVIFKEENREIYKDDVEEVEL